MAPRTGRIERTSRNKFGRACRTGEQGGGCKGNKIVWSRRTCVSVVAMYWSIAVTSVIVRRVYWLGGVRSWCVY